MLTEEEYLLVCLMEEAAEVTHACAKALRFGLDHQWPGRGVANRDAIRDELRDMMRLAARLDLDDFRGLADKGEKFATMMELSRSLGKLSGPRKDCQHDLSKGENTLRVTHDLRPGREYASTAQCLVCGERFIHPLHPDAAQS